MERVKLQIEGMSCGHCVNAVNRALNGVSGAKVAEVQIGRAVVDLPSEGPTAEALVEAVRKAGYRAEVVPGSVG